MINSIYECEHICSHSLYFKEEKDMDSKNDLIVNASEMEEKVQ